jgi:hypothetical protein
MSEKVRDANIYGAIEKHGIPYGMPCFLWFLNKNKILNSIRK